jgi:hypothetical protein
LMKKANVKITASQRCICRIQVRRESPKTSRARASYDGCQTVAVEGHHRRLNVTAARGDVLIATGLFNHRRPATTALERIRFSLALNHL